MADRNQTYKFLVQLGAETDKSIDSVLSGVSSKLGKMFVAGAVIDGIKKLNDMLNTVTKNIVIGAVTIAKDSVESYAELETSVVNAANVFGGSQEEVKNNQEQLLELSKQLSYQTEYSATQIADAAYYMGLAGMDIQEVMEVDENTGLSNLENMLHLAAVSGEDVVTVIDLITDSMSAMGESMDAANVSKFMDELTLTMSSTNTNASQAMESLIKYAATAQATGVTMEEQLGLIGVLANRGIKDSESGTALNSIISRMVGNSTAAKGWAAAGVDLYDEDGNFKGVMTAMTELAEKLENFSDEDQNTIMSEIAGTRQLAKVYDILNALKTDSADNESEFEELIAELGSSNGTLEQMFSEIEGTYEYQAAVLQNNVDGLKTKLGQLLMPIANELLTFATDHMPQIRDVVTKIGDAVVNKIMPVLPDVLENFSTAIDTFVDSGGLEDAIDNISGWVEDGINWLLSIDPIRLGDDVGQILDNLTGIVQFLLRLQETKIGAWLGLTESTTEGLSKSETNTNVKRFIQATQANGADETDLTKFVYSLRANKAGTVDDYVEQIRQKALTGEIEMPQNIYELFGIDEATYDDTIESMGTRGEDVAEFMDQLNVALGEAADGIEVEIAQIQAAANRLSTANIAGTYVGKNATNSSYKGQTAFASGGIVTRPTNALIGEAGEDEAVIPLSKIGQVVNDVGRSGDTITFAPVITVNGGSSSEVKQAVRDSFAEFKANMAQWQSQNVRRAF